jgi:hypothetical protein
MSKERCEVDASGKLKGRSLCDGRFRCELLLLRSPRKKPSESYAPTARIGIVTPVEASDEASMWQRPSKIPPGSTTMHGE